MRYVMNICSILWLLFSGIIFSVKIKFAHFPCSNHNRKVVCCRAGIQFVRSTTLRYASLWFPFLFTAFQHQYHSPSPQGDGPLMTTVICGKSAWIRWFRVLRFLNVNSRPDINTQRYFRIQLTVLYGDCSDWPYPSYHRVLSYLSLRCIPRLGLAEEK